MVAGIYGFLGVIVAMAGVSVGLLVKLSSKVDRIQILLEAKGEESQKVS